jgi:hypothetical protein
VEGWEVWGGEGLLQNMYEIFLSFFRGADVIKYVSFFWSLVGAAGCVYGG